MLQGIRIVTAILGSVGLGVAPLLVEDHPIIPEPEPIVHAQKVEPEKPKAKTWDELTNIEKVRKNPQNCELHTQWMWGDGSCHNKAATVATVSKIVSAPSGTCQDWMIAAGVTDMANAYELIMRESGCRPDAVNPSSGACGIGQQLPCGKWPHTWNDPVGAIIDMQNYVFARYGSWAAAVAWHDGHNWY